MHVTAIIAAAGEGRRLGAAVPKQLLDIGGRSILEHSVAAFASHDRVDDVIVVLPAALVAAPPAWLVASRATVRVVAGGSRRQDSVANAFDRVAPESDVILVHDATRPFVPGRDLAFHRCGRRTRRDRRTPASDTVKRVEGEVGNRDYRNDPRIRSTPRKTPHRPARPPRAARAWRPRTKRARRRAGTGSMWSGRSGDVKITTVMISGRAAADFAAGGQPHRHRLRSPSPGRGTPADHRRRDDSVR
jgi:2-C-methyl-D-erythritol 4-phosphate cytidylyltransferase